MKPRGLGTAGRRTRERVAALGAQAALEKLGTAHYVMMGKRSVAVRAAKKKEVQK